MWEDKLPVLDLAFGVPVVGTNLTSTQKLRGLYVDDHYEVDEGPSCAVIMARYGIVENATVRMIHPKVDLAEHLGFLYALGLLGARLGLDPKNGLILTRVGFVGRKKGDWIVEDQNGDTQGVLSKTTLTDARVVLATALRDSNA
jgi:hypothetical protein